MAIGLKIGNQVRLEKLLIFTPESQEYQDGLQRLEAGRIGHVVEIPKAGRSVIVEFDGKHILVSSQRLTRIAEGKRRGRPKGTGLKPTSTSPTPQPNTPTKAAFVNYEAPAFMTFVANTLLQSGTQADPEAVVVQVKLSELPAPVQTQIQNLMRAKLELGPSISQPAKRGRKTKIIPG